ncbi:MAG: YgjV family protein [Alphaproteobacteria bacterium]
MNAALLGLDAPTLLSGCGAALCLTIAPMFRSRQSILLAQLGAAVFFATHYMLLGITVASVANMLNIVQIGTAFYAVRSAAMARLGYLLIVLMVLSGFWFWQGPISAFSVAAMTLIALARMQVSELGLRLLLIAGGGFWVVHDFIGEAWIALAADIGAILTGTTALLALFIRVTIKWQPLPSARAAVT